MPSITGDANAMACTYAVLLLHDENIPVTADAIKKIVTSVGIDIEPFWPPLFAGLIAKGDLKIDDLISSVGSASGGGGGGPVAAAGGGGEAAAEEKKAEPEEEEEEGDMGFSLFD
mmetsp:Transcript_55085/g.130149  ORF Transcript_55085/g.130149 Transcript_55085/m.130149 type:complete len:115 (-) Transcript_55085:19-363(-)